MLSKTLLVKANETAMNSSKANQKLLFMWILKTITLNKTGHIVKEHENLHKKTVPEVTYVFVKGHSCFLEGYELLVQQRRTALGGTQ